MVLDHHPHRPGEGSSMPTHPRLEEVHEVAPDQEPPRKRTRCLRSCLVCRRAKQRCQLPDSFVEPSNRPLPTGLACKRCEVLGFDCLVVDGVPRPTKGRHRSSKTTTTTTTTPSHHHLLLHPQDPSSSSSSVQRWDNVKLPLPIRSRTSDMLHHAAQLPAIQPSKDDLSSNSGSESDPPPMNDLRIFAPESTVESEDRSEPVSVHTVSSKAIQQSPATRAKKGRDWMKVGRTICRPFDLLGYLLKRQPITQQQQQSRAYEQVPANSLMMMVTSLSDLRHRYDAE
ncbi:hypothetical protein CBS101457_004980 [Exobasidium rhododendri]|nr:hypothetical protein CBS101457_004980 [Exobasidium rhododendri]